MERVIGETQDISELRKMIVGGMKRDKGKAIRDDRRKLFGNQTKVSMGVETDILSVNFKKTSIIRVTRDVETIGIVTTKVIQAIMTADNIEAEITIGKEVI